MLAKETEFWCRYKATGEYTLRGQVLALLSHISHSGTARRPPKSVTPARANKVQTPYKRHALAQTLEYIAITELLFQIVQHMWQLKGLKVLFTSIALD